MKYRQVSPLDWVSKKYGYLTAVRLSPSGSGKPYKGKGTTEGYIPIEADDSIEGFKVDEKTGFLGMPEILDFLNQKISDDKLAEDSEKEAAKNRLPYKNIIDLRPIIMEEIQVAQDRHGWKSSDDLEVNVTLEENMELIVRIGLE